MAHKATNNCMGLRGSIASYDLHKAQHSQRVICMYDLQIFFREEKKKGRSYADLYELVQHAGNVLPRLCATSEHDCMLAYSVVGTFS